MRNLRIRHAKWAARLPFTNTFDTVSRVGEIEGEFLQLGKRQPQ